MRSHPHGRPPCSHSAGREHLQVPESLQPIRKSAIDPPRDQRERKELPAVRVAGQLKADPALFNDRQPMRHVIEQNACRTLGEMKPLKIRTQMSGIGGAGIRNPDDLQTIDEHALIMQHADTAGFERGRIRRRVAEIFMVAAAEKHAVWRGEFKQRAGDAKRIDPGAIVEIAGKKNDGWVKVLLPRPQCAVRIPPR